MKKLNLIIIISSILILVIRVLFWIDAYKQNDFYLKNGCLPQNILSMKELLPGFFLTNDALLKNVRIYSQNDYCV